MEEDQNSQEKIFLCGFSLPHFKHQRIVLEKGLLEGKESLECFDISIPMLSEKKYAVSKGTLHRGKYLVAEKGQKIMEIKSVANNKTVFYGNSLLEGSNCFNGIMKEILVA